jgi:C4-dicarboxylate-specific signal transduction histidine kinase
VVLVGRDETKYHHVQQAIAQATKMVTLGEMATGIAHELSQPLNVIRMAAHNTLNAAARTEAAAEQDDEVVPVSDADFRHSAVAKLDRIMSQVDRAADIISRMRIFGRSSGGHGAAFDVRTPYHSALAMIGSRIRSMGIAIHEEWGEGELPLVGDQNLLEQVFLNLLVNARDALKDSPLKEKQIRVSARRTPEGRTLITIADNGPGVPAEIRERIFEPFFTAKPLGQGTGLGLALAFGIVSEAGGTLTLLPGTSGAAFQIEFPPVAGAPAAS